MNPVDWVLIGALIVFAWAGWRQGFVAGALSFTGFLGGALAGAFLLPGLIEERIEPGLARSLTLAGALLVCAAGGQVLLSYLGRTLRTGITWNPARLVDSAAGAGLNVLALAIVTWIIATAVAFLPQSSVTSQIRNSGVLVGLDSLVPDAVRNGFGQVRDAVGATAVPRIFSGLGEISGPDVQPADPLAADIAAIDDARGSIVRVTGSAAACRSSFSGSGFVIADGYVLTNAHVVAGVRMPALHVRSGEPLVDATVVAFDPKLDAAVLFAPGLEAPSLSFADGTPASGDEAVVGGFPGGGRYIARAVRIRALVTARGDDIYGDAGVAREVYSFRGDVLPGNSGGPLLNLGGLVLGMVFGAGLQDDQTGYAITGAQLAATVESGIGRTKPVDTGSCELRE